MVINRTKKIIHTTRFVIILAGLLLFINAAMMAFITNYNSGIIFTGIIAIALIVCGIYLEMIYKIKWLAFSISAMFIILMSLLSFIAVYGQRDNATYTEDAVIVLGAGINGEQITLPLAYRLDKAVEYYNKNPNAVFVVSGGQGFQETIPEALAMERYLISKGIPGDKIIREEESTSTYTNFAYSKEILDKHFNRDYKVTLITNDYHVYRAVKVAETIGLDCTHCHAEIQWYSIPMSYLRECAAIVKFWIIGV